MTTDTRFLGRNERDFVFSVIGSIFPRLAILGREHFVAQVADVERWTATVRGMLQQEHKVEEDLARGARKGDADRGIPAHLTFRQANERKASCERFERELGLAQKADQESFAARATKSPKAIPGTLGADARGADELRRMSQELATAAQSGEAPVAHAPASTTAPVAAH